MIIMLSVAFLLVMWSVLLHSVVAPHFS